MQTVTKMILLKNHPYHSAVNATLLNIMSLCVILF